MCAIVDGRSVDTSFGLSLQTGLPQMSRSGDLDPFIINYLIQKEGLRAEEVFHALETEGGMLGISGVSNDMRDLEAVEADNPRAKLALDIYCREVARYIGGYAAIMNGLDCIAFTGGIGEKSAPGARRSARPIRVYGVQARVVRAGRRSPASERARLCSGRLCHTGQ